MNKVNLTCNICGNQSFMFKWEYEDEKELMVLSLCHDGFGLQFEDAKVCCSKCKNWMNYNDATFLENK